MTNKVEVPPDNSITVHDVDRLRQCIFSPNNDNIIEQALSYFGKCKDDNPHQVLGVWLAHPVCFADTDALKMAEQIRCLIR